MLLVNLCSDSVFRILWRSCVFCSWKHFVALQPAGSDASVCYSQEWEAESDSYYLVLLWEAAISDTSLKAREKDSTYTSKS